MNSIRNSLRDYLGCGYNSANDERLAWVYSRVLPVTKRCCNISHNDQLDTRLLKSHFCMIETVYRQLEKMDVQRLHARTSPDFAIKVIASLFALTFGTGFLAIKVYQIQCQCQKFLTSR